MSIIIPQYHSLTCSYLRVVRSFFIPSFQLNAVSPPSFRSFQYSCPSFNFLTHTNLSLDTHTLTHTREKTYHRLPFTLSHAGWTTDTIPSPLSGRQDLMSLFNLLPLYDTHVRPYLSPSLLSATPNDPATVGPGGGAGGGGGTDAHSPGKGKGKEREVVTTTNTNTTSGAGAGAVGVSTPTMSVGFTIGGVRIGGTTVINPPTTASGADEKKKQKMEKTYSKLVLDIPGRNTIRKDSHLQNLVLNPDIQPPQIVPFDEQTLREGFSLKAGPLPGFDAMIWEADLPGEGGKKKKKKRKHDQDAGGPGSGAMNGSTTGAGEEEHRKKKKRKEGVAFSPG
ncbi:hypothetical protein T439DRAFT_325424 [Meredithblackwellia eburnea MCA 4105]